MKELDKEFVEKYKRLDDYTEQQTLMAAFAANTGDSVHSIRARLVKLDVYKNKPKTTKVYKSDLVDRLVETMKLEVTDSEHEYLNRLTVTLLRKMLKRLD